MSENAIQVVTEALQKRLASALGKLDSAVFVGALNDDGAKDAAAVVFLYRLAVNAELRNTRHPIPGPEAGKPVVVSERALPLDLHYLITAGDAESGGESPALATLGKIVQTLIDLPNLTGIDVFGETIRLTIDPIGSEEMSRIWTLFPTASYRTSVAYLASPVWIYPALPPVEAAAVTDARSRFGPKPMSAEA